MPRPLERGGMRGLAFRASSPFPFFVTCRGGIRTRRTSHGMLPLNYTAMPVVEALGTNSTRPRPGRCPEHSERRHSRFSARQANCLQKRLSRLVHSDPETLANLGAKWARFDRKPSFRPTVFGLPLLRSLIPASTSHVGISSSTKRSGPLSNGSRGRTFPWSLCRALHVAGCRHDRLAMREP